MGIKLFNFSFATFVVIIVIVLYIKYQCDNRVYNAVMKFAPNAKTILDLGCGKCCTTKRFIESGKSVKALDVVDAGVCMKPEIFDGKKIPYPDNSFDLGICAFVLHHTPNYPLLVAELKRTCKQVIILENTPMSESEWFYASKHARSHWGGCMDCFKDVAGWKKIFSDAGFKLLGIDTISKWLCPFSDNPWFYPMTSTVFFLGSS